MAVYKNSAPFGSIVTDGLVLNLDATNVNSYPGSGTTWTDTSFYRNNGTLINGPTFLRERGRGSIVFDGVNDYVTESNFSNFITNSFTINCWVNFTTNTANQKIFHAQSGSSGTGLYSEVNLDNYNGGSGNPKYHFYTHNVAATSTNDVMASTMDTTSNVWTQVTGVYDDFSKFKYLYINATLNRSGSTTVKIDWPNNVTWIGNRSIGSSSPLNGKISQVSLYNRALSSTEVLQNYNALKSRFGL
jgi:hypothetical protein